MKDNNWHLSKRPTARSILVGLEREIRTLKPHIGFVIYHNSMGHYAIRKALKMNGTPRMVKR